MQVTVHRPNMEAVKTEAARIRAEGDYSGDRDLEFYEWKTGQNNLRLLPPWSAKGLIFKKVLKHFEIPPEKQIFTCQHTWPDKFDLCLSCEALDKVQAQFPEADLGRQRSTPNYYANVIDRDDEEKGVQLCRFSSSVYNWIMLQLDNPKIGDITDYEKGYDLVIDKTEKRRKGGGTYVKYTCSFIPGASPLHESDEAVTTWLTNLFDLDKVFRPLTDEEVSDMQGAASRMLIYYQRRFRGDAPASGSGPSGVADDSPRERTQGATESTGAKGRGEGLSGEETAPESTAGGSEKVGSLGDIDPRSVPDCHAGLKDPKQHEDGTYGFNPVYEKCLLCPVETACMAAKADKGI